MERILNYVRTEPAVILLAINALGALVLAWAAGSISAHTLGIILTASTAVLSLIVALLARPVVVPVVKGAALSVLVAFSSFGVLHLTAPRIAAVTAVLSILVGLLFRTNLTPNPGPVPPAAR